MALNTLKCNHLTPLGLKGLNINTVIAVIGDHVIFAVTIITLHLTTKLSLYVV